MNKTLGSIAIGVLSLAGVCAASAAQTPAEQVTVGFLSGSTLAPAAYEEIKQLAGRVSRECWNDAVQYHLASPRCWVTVSGYTKVAGKKTPLGERRAQRIAGMFELAGVPTNRITTVDLSGVQGALTAPAATVKVSWPVQPPHVEPLGLAHVSPQPAVKSHAAKAAAAKGATAKPAHGPVKGAAHGSKPARAVAAKAKPEVMTAVAPLPNCVPIRESDPHWCVPAGPVRLWTLRPNKTLKEEIRRWAKKADWKVVWKATGATTVPATTAVEGQFEGVVNWAFLQLQASGVLYRVQFDEWNRTVIVSDVSGS